VLGVGTATAHIGDPLVGEAVNRDVHLRLRDVELSPWSVVDPGPNSAIIADLPSVSRQALDREGTKVTVVFTFVLERSTYCGTPRVLIWCKAFFATSKGSRGFSVMSTATFADLTCSGAALKRFVP
jgi:hypothetical protein